MTEPMIYRVAIPTPLRRLFDYLPPDSHHGKLLSGTRVRVAFGRRQVVGIIVETSNNSTVPKGKLKPIQEVLDTTPLIPEKLFELYCWAANYYQHPMGEALAATLPSLLRKGQPLPVATEKHWRLTQQGKGLPDTALQKAPRQQQLLNLLQQQASASRQQLKALNISSAVMRELEKKNLIEHFEVAQAGAVFEPDKLLAESPLPLYPEQQTAFNAIELHGFNSYLLQGETGSGKTEIYLQAIEKVVRCGRQALVLIPEISLTPQTLARFQQRFNCPIAVMHSGLTDNERLRAWNAARTGDAAIVLGTRSTIFTPLCNPGLMIVDEEHDNSFKQQDGFHYSARDLAVVRAHRESIPLILGSATPSLESLYNARQGRYTRLILSSRPGNARQPDWQLIDIRKSRLNTGFSSELIATMEKELGSGNQILVFLNRRGFAPTLCCHDCGWIANCHRCESRLTVHRGINRLLCHHCEYREPLPQRCPFCHSSQLLCQGQGTERSESVLEALFPDTPILRVDRDSTRRKQSMQQLVDQVNSGDPCILVGTQILAKGHHFPNVTLVAIIDADGGLFSTDFRAPERMGQLITQVAGRAGRGDKPGRVMLQSHHCDHPLITCLSTQGYPDFAARLMAERQLAELPPIRHMALLRAEAHNPADAESFLRYARQCAEQLLIPSQTTAYLGPLPSPMEKRSGRYRQQLSVTVSKRPPLQQMLNSLCSQLETAPLAKKVRWSVDVDPQDLT